jgi:hypothetical protein
MRPRLRHRKGEHSGHLARNTLNSAASNAALGGNLEHALSGPQLILDTLFQGVGLKPTMMRSSTERDKLLSGEGHVRSAVDVRFQPSCCQVATSQGRR